MLIFSMKLIINTIIILNILLLYEYQKKIYSLRNIVSLFLGEKKPPNFLGGIHNTNVNVNSISCFMFIII
jgi:hypothetical protein